MPLFKVKSVEGERSVFQVRAAVALLFTVAIIVGFFMDEIKEESFMSVALMSITWYFSKRDTEEATVKPTNPGPTP